MLKNEIHIPPKGNPTRTSIQYVACQHLRESFVGAVDMLRASTFAIGSRADTISYCHRATVSGIDLGRWKTPQKLQR